MTEDLTLGLSAEAWGTILSLLAGFAVAVFRAWQKDKELQEKSKELQEKSKALQATTDGIEELGGYHLEAAGTLKRLVQDKALKAGVREELHDEAQRATARLRRKGDA